LNEGEAQELLEGGTELGVGRKEGADEVNQGGAEVLGGDRLIFAFDDFGHEGDGVGGFKGQSEGAALVEEHAERPDVGPFVVAFVLAELGREVVGGADHGGGEGGVAVEQLGHAQVTNFDELTPGGLVFVDKDIGGFHVSVEDLPGVEVVQPQGDLDEDGPDFVFG
jgi:hypothetical protein